MPIWRCYQVHQLLIQTWQHVMVNLLPFLGTRAVVDHLLCFRQVAKEGLVPKLHYLSSIRRVSLMSHFIRSTMTSS